MDIGPITALVEPRHAAGRGRSHRGPRGPHYRFRRDPERQRRPRSKAPRAIPRQRRRNAGGPRSRLEAARRFPAAPYAGAVHVGGRGAHGGERGARAVGMPHPAKLHLAHRAAVPGRSRHVAYALHAAAEKAGFAATQVHAQSDHRTMTSVEDELLRLLMLHVCARHAAARGSSSPTESSSGWARSSRCASSAADNPFCFEPGGESQPGARRTRSLRRGRATSAPVAYESLQRLAREPRQAQLNAVQHLLACWRANCPTPRRRRTSRQAESSGFCMAMARYGAIFPVRAMAASFRLPPPPQRAAPGGNVELARRQRQRAARRGAARKPRASEGRRPRRHPERRVRALGGDDPSPACSARRRTACAHRGAQPRLRGARCARCSAKTRTAPTPRLLPAIRHEHCARAHSRLGYYKPVSIVLPPDHAERRAFEFGEGQRAALPARHG